jgi:predicted RNA binding protein YcfA (HicA-like mRNA interferase family)
MTKRDIIRHLESYGFQLKEGRDGVLGFTKSLQDGSCVALCMSADEFIDPDGERVTVSFYDREWGPQFTASVRMESFNPVGARPAEIPDAPLNS